MCLIVRGRIGDLLDLDLAAAQRQNSDGWGIHTSRNLAYSFSSKEKDIVKFLSKRKKETVATIHFRFATHGDVNILNAHPFELGDGSFLMHNGILHGTEFDHKTKSDTRMLAEILRDCGPLGRNYILESLTETDWYSNRFCLLHGSSWQKFGDWIYDKSTKTWHSNRALLGGYKSYIPSKKDDCVKQWDHEKMAWVDIDDNPAAASITRGCVYYDDIDEENVILDETDPFYAKITY